MAIFFYFWEVFEKLFPLFQKTDLRKHSKNQEFPSIHISLALFWRHGENYESVVLFVSFVAFLITIWLFLSPSVFYLILNIPMIRWFDHLLVYFVLFRKCSILFESNFQNCCVRTRKRLKFSIKLYKTLWKCCTQYCLLTENPVLGNFIYIYIYIYIYKYIYIYIYIYIYNDDEII